LEFKDFLKDFDGERVSSDKKNSQFLKEKKRAKIFFGKFSLQVEKNSLEFSLKYFRF